MFDVSTEYCHFITNSPIPPLRYPSPHPAQRTPSLIPHRNLQSINSHHSINLCPINISKALPPYPPALTSIKPLAQRSYNFPPAHPPSAIYHANVSAGQRPRSLRLVRVYYCIAGHPNLAGCRPLHQCPCTMPTSAQDGVHNRFVG